MAPNFGSASLNEWLDGWSKSHQKTQDSSTVAIHLGGTVAAPSGALFDLVSEGRWHWVVRYCDENPHDAAYQDEESLETPLHVACKQRPPARVISSLLDAFPEAAETASIEGELPLHLACRFNASIDVLRKLVKEHPKAVQHVTEKSGATAVLALWESRQITDRRENYLTPFWQKMHILLTGLAQSRQEAQGKSVSVLYMVHAVVSLGSSGCPYEIFEFVLDKYSEQASWMDGSGRLPLHIVCETETVQADNNKRNQWEQKVISKLLAKCPAAADTMNSGETGCYPMHTALSAGHTWDGGVKEIFERSPHVLHQPEPSSGLLPFQLAAMGRDGDNDKAVDLSTIFSTLRVQPSALDMARTETSPPSSRNQSEQLLMNAEGSSHSKSQLTMSPFVSPSRPRRCLSVWVPPAKEALRLTL